jgi:peptidoglycan/LPS O-acetylase OafA/YrhL
VILGQPGDMSVAQSADTPDVVAPPPRHPRFPLVDGMRAIAVLCVVLVHCAGFASAISGSLPGRLLAHANIGVTIFFLISGFLLYRPFIAHRTSRAQAPAVHAYAKRRLLRIYPAYWLILTVLIVVPGLPGIGAVARWPMYTLTQTIPIYNGPSCSGVLLGCSLAHTWSLGAELSFYLALPVYVLATERLTRRLSVRGWVTAQAVLLAALCAISLLVQFLLVYPAPSWIGWTVTGNVLWFALGMGLAIVSVACSGEGRRDWLPARIAAHAGLLWAMAITIYVLLCLWLPPTPFVAGAGQQLAIQLAFGVISLLLLAPVIFTDGRRRLPHRIAGAPVVAWLGLISYGIFLWHFPVVLWIGAVHGTWSFLWLCAATVSISVACAAASYYVVERPLMKLKYRRLGKPRFARWAGAAP